MIGEERPPAADGKESPSAGMTDCIRTILAQADEPLSAAEIRDRLNGMGFDMKSYSNALPTVIGSVGPSRYRAKVAPNP